MNIELMKYCYTLDCFPFAQKLCSREAPQTTDSLSSPPGHSPVSVFGLACCYFQYERWSASTRPQQEGPTLFMQAAIAHSVGDCNSQSAPRMPSLAGLHQCQTSVYSRCQNARRPTDTNTQGRLVHRLCGFTLSRLSSGFKGRHH